VNKIPNEVDGTPAKKEDYIEITDWCIENSKKPEDYIDNILYPEFADSFVLKPSYAVGGYLMGKLNLNKVSNVVVEGIDYNDYPDFSDAYISEADYDGIPMTEEQLEELNENSEFVHESVFEQIN
jgi:hypothetical protein